MGRGAAHETMLWQWVSIWGWINKYEMRPGTNLSCGAETRSDSWCLVERSGFVVRRDGGAEGLVVYLL
jgi:hypothetical protein